MYDLSFWLLLATVPGNAALDKDLAELAASMYEMAKLATRLNDKRQSLDSTIIGQVSAAAPPPPMPNRYYLFFILRDQAFAMSTSNIYGVVEASQLVTKPRLPTKPRKAIKLHGTLVPVIDLGAQLGEQPIEIGRNTTIVIVEMPLDDHMQMIDMIVDAVGKVEKIPSWDIQPRETFDSKTYNDLTLGTIMVDNHRVTLLDIGQGLLTNDFVIL
ncbi:chemotaxis protein CheW [Pseudomonas gingeri]|uniref:Chemotaxis protein CheW n=1 Tax=Pseudomonas gingeri TaxID=117681 RepID=A0A7Y7WN02_9PSED|nr:chemotaxis protein CheW [Pseudomonas gingeri]NWB84323.1 chemotaxis protein CheW [Pseudomonas gingeri]